jgi:type IV secretory pathway VirB10-like protein
MRLSLLISLSLLLLSWRNAGAQPAPADDFFNRGAQFYISNNIPDALKSTDAGLQRYPDDVKLKKLYELLKQQQQSQSSRSQPNQQQQSQQQQKSGGQQKQQQPSQQNSQSQQKQNEQNQSGQKNSEGQKQQQQQASAQKQNGEKRENQNDVNQAAAAGQMTPEAAERLLDAQKGDEQVLQFAPQGKPESQNQPVKDW